VSQADPLLRQTRGMRLREDFGVRREMLSGWAPGSLRTWGRRAWRCSLSSPSMNDRTGWVRANASKLMDSSGALTLTCE